MGDLEGPKRFAVDEHVVRDDTESSQRSAHGDHGRLIDVDAVDLANRRRTDAETHGSLTDLHREPLALSARQSASNRRRRRWRECPAA
jgi:hypothetical protein